MFGAAGMVLNVHSVTLMRQRVRFDLIGRVSAASRTVSVAVARFVMRRGVIHAGAGRD